MATIASALKVMLMRHQLPVFCNSLTARALQDSGLVHGDWRFFQTGSAICHWQLRDPCVLRSARRCGSCRISDFLERFVLWGADRSRLCDSARLRGASRSSSDPDRDESRRRTSAERFSSTLVGQATHPLPPRAPFEHRRSARSRRARSSTAPYHPRSSQPRL